MKTKYMNISAILFGLSCLFAVNVAGQDDFTKDFEESYAADKETTLSLSNKYGNIDIKDWEKPTIAIKVEIIIKDVNQQKADRLFDDINIDFSRDGNNISVETDYDDNFFKQVGRSGPGDKFEVNYNVMLPAWVKVSARNKYGSIFINKLASASVIDLSYGTLKINQLIGENKEKMASVELAYSKGSIESCEWLKLSMKYSKLNIQKSKALIVISKYSKLYMETGSSLICESKYDSYEIGKLVNFVAEASYSNYRFDLIVNKISLETKYTDVRVESIPAGFESIKIDNSYGSIRLGIASDASYDLVGYAKYAKISYPDDSSVNRIQENNEQHLDGQVGPESPDKGLVKIETHYGGINL